MVSYSKKWLSTVQSGCLQYKVVAYSTKWFPTLQSGCLQYKVVVYSSKWLSTVQSGCLQYKVVAYSTKWLHTCVLWTKSLMSLMVTLKSFILPTHNLYINILDDFNHMTYVTLNSMWSWNLQLPCKCDNCSWTAFIMYTHDL